VEGREMSTSTNVHGTIEVIVREEIGESGTKWLDIVLTGADHRVTIFGVEILDLVNACEKALHKDRDELIEKLDKLKEVA
jgi:hypothetical protein